MSALLDLDWSRIFVPSEPILETIVRGTCIYLGLFVMLRLFRRQIGALGPADLLVLLLIADAAQNGMADDYRSVTDGLILVATIVFWEYVIDWLSFHFPAFKRLAERPPRPLICGGTVQHENLTRELLTIDELLSQLRQKGVSDPRTVSDCRIEGDGHVSVVSDTVGEPQRGSQRRSEIA
jgi:uncharacterized membrane protein YcaP (DUF421 family)